MRYQVVGRRNLPGFPAFWDGELHKEQRQADDRLSLLSGSGHFVQLDVQPVKAGTVISEFGQRYKGDP